MPLLLGLLLCLVSTVYADWDAWAEGTSDYVLEITPNRFLNDLANGKRKSNVIFYYTVRPSELHTCPNCKTVDPVFESIAYNYKQQAVNVTSTKNKVFFAKMYYDQSSYQVAQRLAIRNLPALVAFKSRKAEMVRFEDDPGRAADNKALEEEQSPALVQKRKIQEKRKEEAEARKKKKAEGGDKDKKDKKDKKKKGSKGKKKSTGRYHEKWAARAAKREKLWNGLATGVIEKPDDGSLTEKNILRFVKRNTGAKVVLQGSPPAKLKPAKVMLALFLVAMSLVVLLARMTIFPAQNAKERIQMEQLRLRGVDLEPIGNKEELERVLSKHKTIVKRPYHEVLPSTGWGVLFIAASIAFLVLVGGFYYNVLNPSPWKGDKTPSGAEQYIMESPRGQYGVECYLVATIGFFLNFGVIAIAVVPSLPSPAMRVGATAAAFVASAICYGVVWVFFLKKNNGIMWDMTAREYVKTFAGFVQQYFVGDI